MLGTEIEPVDGELLETKARYDHAFWYIRDSQWHWVQCTPNQKFYDPDGYPRQAQDYGIGDIIVHRTGNFTVVQSGEHYRETTRVDVSMKRVFLFWANGFLAHT